MKSNFLSLFSTVAGLVAGLSPLAAQEHGAATAPAALAGWSAAGKTPTYVQEAGLLVLPADAQLARAIAGSEFTLTLNSRPAFGTSAGACPVLEVGSAALVFMHDGQAGVLVLVNGEKSAEVLPGSVSLDADGRAEEELKFTVEVSAQVARLQWGGRQVQIPLGESEGRLPVLLTAGTEADWFITGLALKQAAGSTQTATSESGSATVATTTPAPSGSATATASDGRQPGDLGSGSPDARPTSETQPSASATGSTLEVFTPPSVRQGRSESARAAAFGKKLN